MEITKEIVGTNQGSTQQLTSIDYDGIPVDVRTYIKKIVDLTNEGRAENVVSIEKFKTYDYTLSEINQNITVRKLIYKRIEQYLKLYLSLSAKCRSILSNQMALRMIINYFIDKCDNLELKEINLILKEGVSGQFGILYGEFSIDTIIGIDGWIDTYYKKFRVNRADPNDELRTILKAAEKNTASMDQIKQFYKAKGMTLNDLKDDSQCYSAEWIGLPFRLEPYQNKIAELYSLQEMQGEFGTVTRDIENTTQIINSIKRSIENGEQAYVLTKHNNFIIENFSKIYKPC